MDDPLDDALIAAYTEFMNELPASGDPLGEALHFLRMSGTFYCRSEFSAPWALELPPFERSMMFHVVTSGECLLEVEGAERCTLRAGDLALVPHGAGHRLMSAPDVPAGKLFELPREAVSNRYEILRHGEGGAPATMICALVRFDHPAAQRLIGLLPKLIRVDMWQSPEMEWIQSTLRFIAAEAQHLNAGGETVITRLADILAVHPQVMDALIEPSFFGALPDADRIAAGLESSIMMSISAAASRVLTGTTMAPALSAPQSATTRSIPFGR